MKKIFQSYWIKFRYALFVGLKKPIMSHPKLYCIQRVLRKLDDESFVERITGSDTILIRHYGEQNKNRNVYLIRITHRAGFCSALRSVQRGLFDADNLGGVPVVEFVPNSIYAEKEPLFNTTNPFEYYFCQTSEISLEEAYHSNRVFVFEESFCLPRIERDLIEGDVNSSAYIVTDDYLKKLAKVHKKYVTLNERTQKYISDSVQSIYSGDWKNVIGVHIRGTDFLHKWKEHPIAVLPEDYFPEIDNALNTGFQQVFLATDDENYLTLFRERYGTKLLSFDDVCRGTGEINIAFVENERKHHAYLNGLEVLRDAYVLARCGGLIAGLSQVSMQARILKFSQCEEYRFIRILDKGIY